MTGTGTAGRATEKPEQPRRQRRHVSWDMVKQYPPPLLDHSTTPASVAILIKTSSEMARSIRSEFQPGCDDGAGLGPDCEMWLGGLTQWEDHKNRKKHLKNTQKEEEWQMRRDELRS